MSFTPIVLVHAAAAVGAVALGELVWHAVGII